MTIIHMNSPEDNTSICKSIEKNKQVAIISRFGHMECAGFLLESFKAHSVTMIIGKHTDVHEWMHLYNEIYANLTVLVTANVDKESLKKYDCVFNLTAGDWYEDEKVISIAHVSDTVHSTKTTLSLTPYIHSNNVHYTFPVFRPILVEQRQKTILCIGFYRNHWIDDDTITFFKEMSEYSFVFITWGDDYYENLMNIHNVKYIPRGLSAIEMAGMIQKCSFILSKKVINYDRFSGQLSLAMSFDKPLIIDEHTARAYQLPGVIFKNNYTEVSSSFPMDENAYYKHVLDVKQFKETQIKRNRENLQQLISKL